MERLIDATRIEQYILNNCSDNEEINAIYAEIVNAPTIEAEPVRRGRWDKGVNDKWVCSECGIGNNYAYSWDVAGYKLQDRYCPNCGAKMDGEI